MTGLAQYTNMCFTLRSVYRIAWEHSMTMPNERTRALINAVGFLRDLHCAPETPAGMRDQLVGILRHLPEGRAIELEASAKIANVVNRLGCCRRTSILGRT